MATAGGVFDRAEQLQDRLRQGPGRQTPQERDPTPSGPPPSRWTLRSIRATFADLRDYSLSGVWRLLQRCDLKLRSAKVQQYSPDPDYRTKLEELAWCLWETRRSPDQVVTVFLDEMGYYTWPEPGPDWRGPEKPLADRRRSGQQQWRLIGALNAWTGQVTYLDGYIVGRAKVIALYEELTQTYPKAERIYVVQDNWSIHRHPDVLGALASWPQVEPVWLPTYAPWLNPIEKLWRWLRQDVLKLHRWADDKKALRSKVNGFLDQFRHGSEELLYYVGLLGQGKLAQMLRGP